MNHQQIEAMTFIGVTEVGVRNAYRVDQGVSPEQMQASAVLAFGDRVSMHPEMFDLAMAAPFLYQQLTRCFGHIQKLIEFGDQSQQPNSEIRFLMPQLQQMQDAIVLAQQVAQLGVANVAKSFDKDGNPK